MYLPTRLPTFSNDLVLSFFYNLIKTAFLILTTPSLGCRENWIISVAAGAEELY